MQYTGQHKTIYRTVWSLAGLVLLSSNAFAQATGSSRVPDAQIEANVLKSLAAAPELANENITTNTVFGTVTLSGSVKDEPTRQKAETLASQAAGVKKVVDELTLATQPSSGPSGDPGARASTTLGQDPAHAPDPDVYAAQHGLDAEAAPGTPPSPNAPPTPPNAAANYPPPQPGYRPPYTNPQPYGQGQQPYGGDPQAQQNYPNYPPQGSRQPYPPSGYGNQQGPPPPPYGAQAAGLPITVPSGSLLRIRINEGLDSKHSQPGTPFDAIVLNDVVAEGAVAIPRGASVQGHVVNAKSGGVLAGHGELALQLTQVTLGGKVFPIMSDVWARDSSDKGLQTANSAIGLGAAGAIIGAIAGGGAGAAIGAGVGGAAGLGTSAASGSRQVLVPSEAILTFHLAQPAPMTTISQAEMDRLSYGVPAGAQQGPPQMVRRYPPPYYGPVYAPRPYGYPY